MQAALGVAGLVLGNKTLPGHPGTSASRAAHRSFHLKKVLHLRRQEDRESSRLNGEKNAKMLFVSLNGVVMYICFNIYNFFPNVVSLYLESK